VAAFWHKSQNPKGEREREEREITADMVGIIPGKF